MARRVTVSKTCKFCGCGFQVTDTADEVRWYLNVCRGCWEDDAPGMARYERAAAMMGDRWAIDHA
jgi:hypothetical protein